MSGGRRFHLTRMLGSGAFGTVYLAELESLGGFRKQVALKLLRPELGEGSDAGRRLRDEARMLGLLRHRHIVQVDDLVRLDGRYAVVMEYVPGHDLEVLLEVLKAPAPPLAALELTEAVARALASAFGGATSTGEPLNVVHRDIKPSNVRLTAEGEVKVLDFGIARADFQEREAKTENIRYGSIAYMSPERLLGEPETAAGDVYALFCVLYELLCGEPFGRVELAPSVHEEKLEAAAERVSDCVAAASSEEVGAALAALLRRGMAYDVEDRPDAAEVANALRTLKRKVEGEDLGTWARWVIPHIDATHGDGGEPAQGVLSEQTSAVSATTDDHHLAPPPVPVGTQAMPAGSLPPRPAPALEPLPPPPEPSGGGALTMGVIAAVVALLMAGVAFVVLSGGGGDELASTPEEPTGPALVETPSEPATAARSDGVEASTPADLPEGAPDPLTDPAPAAVAVAPSEAPAAGSAEGPAASTPSKPPVTPAETKPAGVTPPVEPPSAAGPRLRAVKFAVAGASEVSARCGDRSASGASSALVRDAPAGACQVTATVDGQKLAASVSVDRARGVDCAVEEGALSCR